MSPSFAKSIAQITTLVLEEFDRQIESQQLIYHTREHIQGVQRRARQIFEVACPDDDRQKLLLDLCAIAHDMIQIFVPQTELHTPRRRASGVSECATFKQLLHYIETVNAQFTNEEIETIEQAILVTICAYDATEQAIYQPDLTQSNLSLIARTIALADIGTLAIEGIEAYNQEGRLLFLEENPDILPLLDRIHILEPELRENIRQRLLKRACFQVNFARSRFARLPQELDSLPTISALMQTVFKHATPETLERLEAMTPTSADTSLETLLKFFQFDNPEFLQGIVKAIPDSQFLTIELS
jgi:hypothetical protein